MTVYRPVGEQDAHGPASFFGRHRRIVTVVVGAVLAAGFVFFVVPRIVGLGPTLKRLRGGGIGWLALGVGLEAFSTLGDIVMFRGAFAAHGTPIGWRPTADIPMAGAAATKLLAAAGSGGIALTVWTLRGWGLSAAEVAGGLACYLLLTYAVYLLALAGAGFGLWLGLFPGPAPVGLTLIPAIVAAAAILVVLSMLHLDAPTERLLERRAERSTGGRPTGGIVPQRCRGPSFGVARRA